MSATTSPILSPESEAQYLAHLKSESSIAIGSVLLEAEEMAPRLGVTVEHLRVMADANKIPSVKVGKRYRFNMASVILVATKGGRK